MARATRQLVEVFAVTHRKWHARRARRRAAAGSTPSRSPPHHHHAPRSPARVASFTAFGSTSTASPTSRLLRLRPRRPVPQRRGVAGGCSSSWTVAGEQEGSVLYSPSRAEISCSTELRGERVRLAFGAVHNARGIRRNVRLRWAWRSSRPARSPRETGCRTTEAANRPLIRPRPRGAGRLRAGRYKALLRESCHRWKSSTGRKMTVSAFRG